MNGAAALRNQAQIAAKAGDMETARRIYARAVADYPGHAALLNSAGNFHAGIGELEKALALFDKALTAEPEHVDAILNRALMVARLGRSREAMADLAPKAQKLGQVARYWSVRASLERGLGLHHAAAASTERWLAIDPDNSRALHGRARLALERGEQDMIARFEAALDANRSDAAAWLGYAQALDYGGRPADARKAAEALVAQAPGWIEAHQFLAQLLWANGERADFTRHFADAVKAQPDNAALYLGWSQALAGVDQFEKAAAVAADGFARLPGNSALALACAVRWGEAGDDARAERLFAAMALSTPDRWLQEARHRLRRREPDQAERLLARVIEATPDTVSAWALRDLAWRMMDDPRCAWLHQQDGLVRQLPLGLEPAALNAVVSLLNRLHDKAAMPVGQSVREGSQTRGGLFDRLEPELQMVRKAVEAVAETYRSGLPAADRHHPLLQHREALWAIRGSWSIRMAGGGRHTEHVHPQGLLSSALHLVVPSNQGDCGAGALELGRSPPDLRIDLPPFETIQPRVGHCVLFPSTVYHGTRPFPAGLRLSIAFDIALAPR